MINNFRERFLKNRNTGLIREFDDNYYDKIRVYRSQSVMDISSASDFAARLRCVSGLRIDRIYFEDLQLRDEENALPIEEEGTIRDELISSYIQAACIDIIKFVGEYNGKRIEIGISKNNWEVWLRIWHLTDAELNTLEETFGLS